MTKITRPEETFVPESIANCEKKANNNYYKDYEMHLACKIILSDLSRTLKEF